MKLSPSREIRSAIVVFTLCYLLPSPNMSGIVFDTYDSGVSIL